MRETDLLDLYLAKERACPFEWTSLSNGDCLLFALGWAERLGFHSPTPWRGSYSTEREARHLLQKAGGPVAAITDVLGPPRMASPASRGDIALIAVRDRIFGAVCTGNMWAFRAIEGGVGFCRLPADVVWNTRFSS